MFLDNIYISQHKCVNENALYVNVTDTHLFVTFVYLDLDISASLQSTRDIDTPPQHLIEVLVRVVKRA